MGLLQRSVGGRGDWLPTLPVLKRGFHIIVENTVLNLKVHRGEAGTPVLLG